MKTYNDYNELLESDEKLATELLKEFGEGAWQNESIAVHKSLTDFAEYEVAEGWYASLGIIEHNYNGAPALEEYIDYEGLGDALSDNWDESTHYLSNSGQVVTVEDTF